MSLVSIHRSPVTNTESSLCNVGAEAATNGPAGSVPVLVRGGGRVTDEELLNRTAEVLKQGAAGIVYGRNIIAHPNPAKMTQALMAMLHKGTSAADALKIVNS